MKLEFVCQAGCQLPAGTRAALVAVAARLAPAPLVVHVVTARDGLLRRLNEEYRGQARTTDVLAFRYESGARGRGGAAAPRHGPDAEVYVSLDRTVVQAREHGHSRGREFVRLVLHGLLHLQGHDHHSGPEACRMRAAETRALRWLAGRYPRLATTGLVPPGRRVARNSGR